MSVDAGSKEEAVIKLKEMMNEESVMNHISESHSGESAPTVQELHSMIDRSMRQDF